MEIKNLPIQYIADITSSNALKMHVASVSIWLKCFSGLLLYMQLNMLKTISHSLHISTCSLVQALQNQYSISQEKLKLLITFWSKQDWLHHKNTVTFSDQDNMWCYWKVPRLGKKRNAGLTYSILPAMSFKIVLLGIYTVIPSFFSTLQKHCGSHFP
jgi:hypothetical protein